MSNKINQTLRIVTWNCKGNYEEKEQWLKELKPDIAIIPESENPEIIAKKRKQAFAINPIWKQLKDDLQGLGVFFYKPYEVKVASNYTEEIKTAIPLEITDKNTKLTFHILAIWANNPKVTRGQRYIHQVALALKHYESFLKSDAIIIGDFNSPKLLTSYQPKKLKAKELLDDMGFVSAYHHYHKAAPNHQPEPTLYWYFNKEKPYMVDYCFISQSMLPHLKHVEVGSYEKWVQPVSQKNKHIMSDHAPVICDFEF